MKQRRKNAFFQDLLEAGSRTTYHGKIRGRSSGRPRATVSRGKQRTYKGVQIIPLGGGEYTISIDRDSRFENVRDAKKVIDHMRRSNPEDFYNFAVVQGSKRPRNYIPHYRRESASQIAYEAAESLRKTHTLWGNDGSGNMTKLETWTTGKADARLRKERGWNPSRRKRSNSTTVGSKREVHVLKEHVAETAQRLRDEGHRDVKIVKPRGGSGVWKVVYRPVYHYEDNPRGSKGKFQRCVESVAARGGAYDPRAICGAMEKRLKNPDERYMLVKPGRAAASYFYTQNEVYRYLDEQGGKGALARGMYKIYRLGAGRKELVDTIKRNPAAGAIAVSEEFHGRKVKQMVPVQETRHYHKYLADLGELRKLVVLTRDGKGKVTLTGFKGAMLTCNEAKDQLFITGGDQTVNPKDFGIDHPHEVETLGEVVTIEYFTDKHHLGSEGGTATYTHKFRSTNENGKHVTVRTARNPDLIYHKRDKHLEFSGGSYLIRKEGIDL